ncbi:LysR family transcriptional regulator [Vibrio sp. Of14-4]|uniref:LysR family transcriptional regulator n=1 Tax=Vibrio tetraodonis subsp. pristinus TaxID=2695891 RepID=A0A6L8M0S7_9VIBR|nr:MULTISPECIES: LysR family transcriptional regulator [Vibrio]MCG7491876.1 LysR family transcriptional regulator [Vibrio sp. Of14-4]MYM61413.1 LysR family transcriptional regulator [Vibrio tetraodonis subsp. pristinus]
MRSQLINIVIFITLYEKGNFRKTSSELGVSLGTISKSIKSLEEDSPSPLFIKSNGDFKPTTYAHTLYGHLSTTHKDLLNKYNLFKSITRHINVLIPPQIASYNLVDSLVKFNNEFNTQLIVNEGIRPESYEAAYTSLIIGELDFMLDVSPNHSSSFVSQRIGTYPIKLLASKKYHDSISVRRLTKDMQFAKYTWLGKTGSFIHEYMGIPPDSQVGFITQSAANYFEVIKKTPFIGCCTTSKALELGNDYVYDTEAFMELELYFVTTKSALSNKPVVKWFYDNFKDGSQLQFSREV